MNTFVLIGLVLLLVGVLVANRRKRAAGSSGTSAPSSTGRSRRGLRRRPEAPSQGLSAPSSFPETSSFGEPSPFGSPSPFDGPTPFDRPAPYSESPPVGVTAPAPAAVAEHAPPPAAEVADWTPEETIVEPGWPMPGEISGAWASAPAPAPAAYGQGPAAAEWETAATATATVQAPAPDAHADEAIADAAEAWEMPALSPIAHEAEGPGPDAPLWVPETPAAQEPAPLWEPEPSSPVAEAPAWAPETPVHEPWDAAPAADPTAEPAPPEHEPVTAGIDPVGFLVADVVAPEPAVAAAAPAPVVTEPEPEVVWAAAPTWAPAHDAEPEVEAEPEPRAEADAASVVAVPAEPEAVAETEPAADLREQSAQVAALVPGVIASLRPITRVSDQLGITPRMLVVVGALAERPLSVTEQAAVLGVSRPVVADISARLEASGLATRERDERDRRRIRIVLTERGRRLHEEAGEASADDVQVALARMDPVERDHLLRGLRALARPSAA